MSNTFYQGSQAYAQQIPSEEAVSPNTGSVGFTKILVDLRGKTTAIGLRVQLSYSPGAPGAFGLPANWTFNLPFTIPSQSLTAQGKTYVVDPNWSDETGQPGKNHRSGLRYVNNHGVLFKHIWPAQPLPSDHTRSYEWRYQASDGTIDYFDTYGKVLEHDDRYGNAILFSYVDQFASPSTARLDFILDSWGQKVSFGYDFNVTTSVTAPDGGKVSITPGSQGITRIQDAMGYVTTFSYTQKGQVDVINTITYPTGLLSEYQYTMLSALDANGNSIFLPACSRHRHRDAAGNIMADTQYAYGQATGYANFTGYTIGCRMDSATDALIDSNNDDYRYDVTVSRMDGSGQVAQTSRVYYNFLHLSMQEDHWNSAGDADIALPAYRSINTYLIPIDLHARAPSYQQPVQIEQWHLVGGTYQLLRRATSTYDWWDCPLTQLEEMWNPDTQQAIPQKTLSNTYFSTVWGGQLLASEIYVDNITGHEKQINYQLTPDQFSTATSSVTYRDSSNAAWLPWKTKAYTYDSVGRVTQETTAWADGAIYPINSVTSYTYQKSYTYDSTAHLYTEQTKDPLGFAGSLVYDMRVKGGPLVVKISPLGNKETLTYDLAGRLTQTVDALGIVTNTTRSIGVGQNYMQNVTALGYVTRTTYDALGRAVEISDNGDTSQPNPTRVLAQTEYDALSRIVKQTDEQQLATTQTFDALNRLLTSTDCFGNVTMHTYDDEALTLKVTLNGDLRSIAYSDRLGRQWREESYADSATPSDYIIVSERTYDGFGKVLDVSSSQQTTASSAPAAAGTIVLSTASCTFDVENKPIHLSTSSLPSNLAGSPDVVVRDVIRDIFGNAVLSTKTVQYADGRVYKHAGSLSEYDANRRLIKMTNQLGQLETNIFDADGRLINLTRFDGTTQTYTYDAIGHQTASTTPAGTTTFTYLSSGRLSTTTRLDATVQHAYSLDGSIEQTTYPDGKTQQYVLDKTSRVQQEIDAAGTQTTNSYDSYGRLASKQLQGSQMNWHFGTVNKTTGAAIGYSVTGAQSFDRSFSFDGFGRTVKVTDRDPAGQLLLSTTYLYDSRGRILSHELQSDVYPTTASVNRQELYQYDGLGQLISVIKHYPNQLALDETVELQYDGNYNIIQQTTNGVPELRNYNALDQRADAGFVYDANGRMVADPTGRTYAYDSDDRLLSVTGGSVPSSFQYNPDDSLSTLQDASGHQRTFYYSGGAVNASADNTGPQTPSWTSYLVQPQGRLAAQSSGQPTATYLESRGSVALTLGSKSMSASDYNAYGATTLPSEEPTLGWLHELEVGANEAVYLRSRFYSPMHRIFLTMDGSRSQENRYAYCRGDPINRTDSTGHDDSDSPGLTIAAGLVGAVVGVAVSVASFGTLAWLGLSETAMSMSTVGVAAGTASGSLGNLAGDAAAAGMQHQSFTGARAGEDLLTGGVGGLVGSAAGGWASASAARLAVNAQLNLTAVQGIDVATSSVVGGSAGSFASAGTAALLHRQPLFSRNTALAALMGAGVGAAGATVAGGAYLGLTRMHGIRVLPVFLRPSEGVQVARAPAGFAYPERVWAMSHPAEHQADFRGATTEILRAQRAGDPPGPMHSAVIAHGDPGHLYATVRYRGEQAYRPMTAATLAAALQRDPAFRNLASGAGPNSFTSDIKLISCKGGYGNAQALANAMQLRVWGVYKAIYVKEANADWIPFDP